MDPKKKKKNRKQTIKKNKQTKNNHPNF